MEKQLHQIENGKIISGVCNGFAKHYGINVWLLRIIWILCSAFLGAGLLAYVLSAVVLPLENK